METEKTESSTTSRLLVTQARLTDSGNYTCIPSNANPASVMVHVLNGKSRFYSLNSRSETLRSAKVAFLSLVPCPLSLVSLMA